MLLNRVSLLLFLALLCAADASPFIRYGPPELLGHLEDDRITESSGLAAGLRNENVFWTHNDSGDGPVIYAIGPGGQQRGVVRIAGTQALDWEDMESLRMDDTAFLLIADVGDNERKRKRYTLYLVPEPDTAADETPVSRTIHFTYEDGPHDCESVAVDGQARKIYLVVKVLMGEAGVYELDLFDDGIQPLKARRVAGIPVRLATAMSISPDNRRAVVGTYGDAYEFYRAEGETWPQAFSRPPRRLPMPARKQGESICYSPDGSAIYLTSEKTPTPLWKVPVINP